MRPRARDTHTHTLSLSLSLSLSLFLSYTGMRAPCTHHAGARKCKCACAFSQGSTAAFSLCMVLCGHTSSLICYSMTFAHCAYLTLTSGGGGSNFMDFKTYIALMACLHEHRGGASHENVKRWNDQFQQLDEGNSPLSALCPCSHV